ncbi:TIGR03435 family protein [Pontibacter harenae]|uniref:TIGR03435 family protein n=1 Tax=Pontibacter harenae TaxID=2894083 RepID=UPI001E3DBBF0|nr:TIGR03435 family protein [Pontibacter harenae]MCC9167339.1 TIGR03435 family protein [Pontibacter harenae]
MQKTLLPLLFLLLILQVNTAKAAAPEVGEAAPKLQLTGLLQASGKLEQNLNSLKGKVVVLEFWATWCAPCIAAMPHLNELSEKYKNKGVQFISVTDETDEKAKNFLKKRKINGWVGIDGNEAMHEAYEVQAIPFTVVIGADGNVLGYPDGKTLSEEMLNKALAGKTLTVATDSPEAPTSNTTADLAKPLYELSIRPSASQGMSNMLMPQMYRTKGAQALDIIKIAFDATDKQTEVTTTLPEGGFDVVATNPGKGSPMWAWRPQLQQMLQDVWAIEVRQEQKEMEVYELITTTAAAKRLREAAPEEAYSQQSSDEGVLAGRNTSTAGLAKILQNVLKEPVVDATNLQRKYDYNLYFDENKPETLLKSLEEEMGLKLRKVKRPIELLVIAPKK